MNETNPILLFDGICNLCNNSVDFIIRHDREKRFRFASLQSDAGKRMLEDFRIPLETDSVILIVEGHAYTESDAALETARLLPYPWKLLSAFKIIPRRWRNAAYQWIAQNRYRWFGKRNTCRLPTAAEKELFID